MTERPPEGDNNPGTSHGETTATKMAHSTSSTESIVELDEVFAALDHPRRRYLLYTLVNEGSEKPLAEVATKIAAWEQDKPASEVTDAERRRVHVSLHHAHVPKLTDLDIIEYQEDEDLIVRARNTDQVQAVLDGAGAELDARQQAHAQHTDVEDPE